MEKMIIFYRTATEREWAEELADKYIPIPSRTFASSYKRALILDSEQRIIEIRKFSNESSARGLKADFVLIPKDFDLYTKYFHVFIGITNGNQDTIMFYSDGRD